jgi:hypothetical protein
MKLGDKELHVFPFVNFFESSFKYGRPFFWKQEGVTFMLMVMDENPLRCTTYDEKDLAFKKIHFPL